MQQPAEKRPQLVEVVGTGEINIISDTDLIALRDRFNTKDHDRHLLPQRCPVADAAGRCNDMSERAAQTHQNEVGRLARGCDNRVFFLPSRVHAMAISLEQLLYAITGLLNILHHEDKRGKWGQTRYIKPNVLDYD